MSQNPVGWFVGILLFVIGFIVVGVVVEGAVTDGLQRAADQIGGPVAVLVAVLILGGTVAGVFAFFGGLSDRFHDR